MQKTKQMRSNTAKKSTQTGKTNSHTSKSVGHGEYKLISINELDMSRLNYRKSFPKKELDELAADIAVHGIISNLVVRKNDSGRYELVAGERRFRAAKMAGLEELPVIVVNLNDQEVMEIQLSENLQRSDTHPMEEAFAVARLQNIYQSIDEIAFRLGKSKTFVYKRLKLVSLIDPIRELFMSDKCTTQQAYDIASLSAESQTDFYKEYCSDWQNDTDFEIPDTGHSLNRFRLDLTKAPFDIKDKKLLPEKGACTSCAYNSASVSTLFPDQAKEAVCSNRDCYKLKYTASFIINIQKVLKENKPDGLLFYGGHENYRDLLLHLPETSNIPQFCYFGVDILNVPVSPREEDYTDENGEGDEESFKDMLEEYENELNDYLQLIGSGKFRKGLLISEGKLSVVMFNPEERTSDCKNLELPKAADVQLAIKSGTATVGLLQGEIDRIHTREERLLELDREKVQILVHDRFIERLENLSSKPTSADLVAVRLILFQSLDYSARNTVLQALFMNNEKFNHCDCDELYKQLGNLSEDQFAYLIRMAIVSKSDSKNPKSETGYFLYKMAGQAGLDLNGLEIGQKERADKRQAALLEKISRLRKQMENIKS